MSLRKYSKKRNFLKTPEPKGKMAKTEKNRLHFVIHKHQASHLHYDLRLESRGVLKSWAVPKGIPKKGEKKLAMMVEDHPFEYKNFEGIIPAGNYGAGIVMIWDEGFYYPKNKNLEEGIKKGEFSFILDGKKLSDEFSLVKFDRGGKNSWLLIGKSNNRKKYDELISVVSGKTMEEIGQGKDLNLKNAKGSAKSKILDFIKPMLAVLIDKPFDEKDWIFEFKWDGYRVLARKEDKNAVLFSRNRKSFNEIFFPILESVKKIPGDFILDGEVVVADRKGKTNFQSLQNYLTKREGRLIYYVFDIVFLNGYDLKKIPLIKRKEILNSFLPKLNNVKISDHIEKEGKKLFEIARQEGMEGIIAKNMHSFYREGKRSSDWLKIKIVKTQEAVIGGFTEPRGSRKKFGALVLGVYENGNFVYIGHTGGGFTEKDLNLVISKLRPLVISKSPFKNVPKTNMPATWVKPELVCQVKFTEWTSEGIMRQPVFFGLREDKKADEVGREIPKKEKIDSKNYANPKKDIEIIISGRKLKLTNLEKVFWPEEGYTKGDLINYYRKISKFILPYLKDRPESLNRFPNGIYKENFFQKDMEKAPNWIEKIDIESESEGKKVEYMLCQNEASLVYMANLASIEINPWNSRIGSLDDPDYMVLDIDPSDDDFLKVIKVALETKKILDKIKVKSFCKTSGATGLHIYVPLGSNYNHEQAREFGRLVNFVVNQRLPEITSIERNPKKRKNKIYLDFLQNSHGQTLVAPYSVRPRKGAPVSTPLEWKEVNKKLDPKKFTIKTIFKRIKSKGDLWKGVLGKGIDMKKAIILLDKINKKQEI